MGQLKEGDLQPDPNYNPELEGLSPVDRIVAEVADLSPEEIAQYCIKLNKAIIDGDFDPTVSQRQSLNLLSNKFIPDAPKQINLSGTVRVEETIDRWLEHNQQALQKVITVAAELAEFEEEQKQRLALEAPHEAGRPGEETTG